jgi:hypothetical protein
MNPGYPKASILADFSHFSQASFSWAGGLDEEISG